MGEMDAGVPHGDMHPETFLYAGASRYFRANFSPLVLANQVGQT